VHNQTTTPATTQLPEGYQPVDQVDLKENRGLLILMNILAIPMVVIGGWLIFQVIALLRPAYAEGFQISISSFADLLAILAAVFLMIVIHEAFHGVFFWWFTRARPVFAFKLLYAYAGAPDWYIRRNPFIVITLAPLVGMTLIGLLLLLYLEGIWASMVFIMLALNIGGATGDLLVVYKLARRPASTYVRDTGDQISIFTRYEILE
jgi:hypothetical protein